MKNILLLSAHAGGGVGSVLMDWVDKDINNNYTIALLDYANDKIKHWAGLNHRMLYGKLAENQTVLSECISRADVVVLNYWDHPMLADLFADPLPDCRLVFWCHKNIIYSDKEVTFPDLWVDTSPIQGHGKYIWSTGNMERFLKIIPKAHEGFNVGTVASPKLHPDFTDMCGIIKHSIPEARFTILGEWKDIKVQDPSFIYTGKVDDVAPYLAEFDVFGYPLRPDHYGTAEQALGEAMAAGAVPVVMDNPAERMIVKDYESGMVADHEKDYIECIEMLAITPERLDYACAARDRAIELYSIDNMISQWNDVFDELMKQPKRKRGVL